MRLFGQTRTALDAAHTVKGSAADLYESMWKPPAAAYTVGLTDIPGLLSGAYSLDTAMMVPAFARGMNIITGVGAGLPLYDLDPRTGEGLQPYGITAVEAMWPEHTNATLWRRTITDLVCHARAHWHVLRRNGQGHPTQVEPIEPDRVQVVELGVFILNGQRVEDRTWLDARDVITFELGTAGVLDHGWLAIRTALSLETAANNYAASPMPALALKSTGVDLDDADVEELLTTWDSARRSRATAYLNSLIEVEQFGWNASEMQLTEARQHAAVEIARLLNLDPYFVGATVGGSSVTYQNRTDLYQSLLDFTIMPLLRIIEQRLSMTDIIGERRQVRFDTSAFLRANLADRVSALTTYVGAGVITPEQAAALEPMIRQGDVPQ